LTSSYRVHAREVSAWLQLRSIRLVGFGAHRVEFRSPDAADEAIRIGAEYPWSGAIVVRPRLVGMLLADPAIEAETVVIHRRAYSLKAL
jgi:hypothetical protein